MNAMPDPGRQWPGDDGQGTLAAYEGSVSIGLIATGRSEFCTCRPEELISAAVERADSFDFLPVVSESADGGEVIVGILHAAAERTSSSDAKRVCDHMEPLSEGHLIGADAS